MTADQRRTALSRTSVVRSRTVVRSLSSLVLASRISRCSLSKGFAADDLRLTLSPSSSTRSRTCCTLTRFLTLVSRDPRSSLRVFDGRSPSNCFVACLSRSFTYLRTLAYFLGLLCAILCSSSRFKARSALAVRAVARGDKD